MEDKKKDSKEPVKSTTQPLQIYHAGTDDDVLIIRLDAKHPARRKIFSAIQSVLEATPEHNEEATKVKAYAQEHLPDDWKRKQGPEKGSDQPAIRHPGEAQRPMVEPHNMAVQK